ncbi:MAG: hypothetical protein AAGI53_10145 [Planctomycetota bacterium]
MANWQPDDPAAQPDRRPEDPDQRLCDAATAVFFSLVRREATRTGKPVPLPRLVCPASGVPPHPGIFNREELQAAEEFLYRIGMISLTDDDDGIVLGF